MKTLKFSDLPDDMGDRVYKKELDKTKNNLPADTKIDVYRISINECNEKHFAKISGIYFEINYTRI